MAPATAPTPQSAKPRSAPRMRKSMHATDSGIVRGPLTNALKKALRERKRKLLAQFQVALDQLDDEILKPRPGTLNSFLVEISPEIAFRVALSGEESPMNAGDSVRLDEALAAARARGRTRVAEIVSGEDMLNAEDFGELIGVSRATVNNKRMNHELLGLEGAKRGFRFPKWQLDANGRPFAVLPQVFEKLDGDAWAVYRLMVQHHGELNGRTGLQAMAAGDNDAVLDVAMNMAGGNA